MDAAAINWTLLVIDHLNPSFLLNCDLSGLLRSSGLDALRVASSPIGSD
jgi:hypothetical protein